MELDDKIRNLITACFGINAETIRHATPEWLSKMVSSCDTDVIRRNRHLCRRLPCRGLP